MYPNRPLEININKWLFLPSNYINANKNRKKTILSTINNFEKCSILDKINVREYRRAIKMHKSRVTKNYIKTSGLNM